MARINIEECWWTDPRRDQLREALGTGNQDQVAIRAWRLAQEFWSKEKLVPWNIFKALEGAEAFLKVGLAQLHEGSEPSSNVVRTPLEHLSNDPERYFVYVSGSCEYLSWVREQRIKAAIAGKKSVESRRKKDGTAQPRKKNLERTSNEPRTLSNALEPSVSGSNSVSGSDSDSLSLAKISKISKSESETEEKDSAGGEKLESPSPVSEVWRSYKRAYEEKHGTGSATWNSKIGGQIKQFVKRVPQDEAPDIAEFFVSHNSSYYVQSGHPIGLLLKDAEKLRTEWLTGRKMTATRARQLESRDANIEAVQSYLEEKIAGGHS